MIKNYFKTAYRNLRHHKTYVLINISGLATGMAACLLIFLVVCYELSYEKAQPAYEDIYRVVTQDKTPDGIEYNPGIPYPALEALRIDFPAVTTGALFATFGTQVSVPNAAALSPKKFIENTGLFFCDPQFFDVFFYKWIAGNSSVLGQPNVIALTRTTAAKYFGDWKIAMGKVIKINNALDLRVEGILEDLPANTDLPITMMGSYITLKNSGYYGYTTDWGSTTSNFQVYMRLPENISSATVNGQLAQLANKYYKNTGVNKRKNTLQALADIHFNPALGNFGDHVTTHATLLTLSMIGFFIILMACINFINLSTAQAVTRSKEIGARKVLGGSRSQLFTQVMGETGLIVTLAALAAILIASLALPYIKYIVSINENLNLVTPESGIFIFSTALLVTVLSGLYPAIVLSGFGPVMALKNKISSATVGGITLRRGLVITQFAISQALIVGTIVAVSQMDFIRTADLGFNKDAIVVLSSSSDSSVLLRQKPFKENLLKIPGVKHVSLCSDVPSSDNNSGTNFAFNHQPDENFTLFTKFADADYFKTFGLEFSAGEAYQPDDTSGKVVVNETLLKKLNIKNTEEAIGKDIRMGGGRWRQIVGVVKDFKTNSLREEIKPLMIAPRKKHFSIIAVKLLGNNLPASQAEIQRYWDRFFPEYAFDASFMDENIERFYQQEKQMALLYKIFASLAIFISCLGLYGLVSFMVVQKTKEVGIRKVLGAGIHNIVLLFSKEFTILIGVAFTISVPLGWFLMNNWLNNFVYRVSIHWQVFAVSVVISILIAWVAVGFKAIRAAMANPVKSLRTE
ncbi:MAG TPA: ABC transporter permease [Bacteroidia bacterium]|nr:ABC transporter permease [Bacteroidia bacterium]